MGFMGLWEMHLQRSPQAWLKKGGMLLWIQAKLRRCCPFPGGIAKPHCPPLGSNICVHSGTEMEKPSCPRQEIPQWSSLDLHHCSKAIARVRQVPFLFVSGLSVFILCSACVYVGGMFVINKVQAAPPPVSNHRRSPSLWHFQACSHLLYFSIEQHQRPSLLASVSS